MRTWQFELLVASAVLLAVTVLTGGGWVQLVGAGAVILSFAHMQVADRLAEGERERSEFARGYVQQQTSSDVAARWAHGQEQRSVHCHAWAGRYLVGKELLWLVYFVALGAWSALAGVALFLLYPAWRRFYRG